MLIRLNALGRATPADLEPILPALAEASQGVDLDIGRLTVLLDWVQYRKNFRERVVARPFLDLDGNPGGTESPIGQIAIDVRRAANGDLADAIHAALQSLAGAGERGGAGRLYLEELTR